MKKFFLSCKNFVHPALIMNRYSMESQKEIRGQTPFSLPYSVIPAKAGITRA